MNPAPPVPAITPRAIGTVGGAVSGAVASVGGALALGTSTTGDAVDVAFLLGALAGACVAGVASRRWPTAPWLMVAAMPVLCAAPLAARSTPGAVAVVCLIVAMAGFLLWRRLPVNAAHSTTTTTTMAMTSQRGTMVGAVAIAAVAVVVYSVFAVERHQRFGSGSWDYGCYLHNAWLFAHGDAFSLEARSAVLGDVAFWGGTNHFMPSLILTVPVAWLMEATHNSSWLIVAQNVVVAAAAVPLALLARRRGLGVATALALAAAWCFHIGVQSALLFDVHEIAPVPLALVCVLLVVEERPSTRRTVLVVLLAAILAGTKESAWLYLVGVGALLTVGRPGWRPLGVVLGLAGLLGFAVVVGVIQPALLEPNSPGMIHAARFPGVGDVPAHGLAEAALSMLRHPGRTVALLLTPATKVATLTTLSAGYAWLPLWSWEGLVLGLPNLAERFLADKKEMWGTAFHYSLVTAAWLAWGAVHALSTLQQRRRLPDALLAVAIAVGVGVSWATAERSPDLAHLEQPYFASPTDVERYQRALAHIGADDAVVAQNHFLPHVALRRHIWLPEPRFIDRADAVMLDTAASPWPNSALHVARLVASLQRDPRFHAVFHEGSTWVFRRQD